MKKRFINFSNHPTNKWDTKQLEEAEKYGEILDIEFPNIDPTKDESYIQELAKIYTKKILDSAPSMVLCQGEFCLAFSVITMLKKKGVPVVAACSERIVREEKKHKVVDFSFVRFREY